MTKKRHIEDLREMFTCLEYDAQFLYQYGSLSVSLDLWEQLGKDDKRRLVALALREGNSDVQNVARCLMTKLEPRSSNLEQVMSQMNPEDRKEIEGYGVTSSGTSSPRLLRENDKRIILGELREACNTFGSTDIEEAYWVLIPEDNSKDIIWINAMGGEENEFFTQFGSPYEVGYNPSRDELNELITNMRNAFLILHIHNHPTSFMMPSLCLPSDKDLRSASGWKSGYPDLAKKMMFFVIQANMAVEYGREAGGLIRWI